MLERSGHRRLIRRLPWSDCINSPPIAYGKTKTSPRQNVAEPECAGNRAPRGSQTFGIRSSLAAVENSAMTKRKPHHHLPDRHALLAATIDLPTKAEPRENARRDPIVVELFTSQGCLQLPSRRPAAQAASAKVTTGVIALAYHVDYWNYIALDLTPSPATRGRNASSATPRPSRPDGSTRLNWSSTAPPIASVPMRVWSARRSPALDASRRPARST